VNLLGLALGDFRLFRAIEFHPTPDATTVLTGQNGAGKTSVLEAVAYLGSQRSFRGAPRSSLVRAGEDQGIVRAELQAGDRPILVEAAIPREGRARTQVNRQAVRSRAELANAVPVTVFAPGDLLLVQGGPAGRREYLDDTLVLWQPGLGPALDELERSLRQRAALLRQAQRRRREDVSDTLAVWDDRIDRAGTAVAEGRRALLTELAPRASAAYRDLAGPRDGLSFEYLPSWSGSLREALAQRVQEDLRRAATSVGPHRDDLALTLGGRDTRTEASQGEQRSVALALRLAAHGLAAEVLGTTPILLLDDVFSELDPVRSRALVDLLPAGQALVSTAGALPDGVAVAQVCEIERLAAAGAQG
jgi:DNA replication and repair protein RecF